MAACVLTALSSPTWANPQHERMRSCNQEAKQKALKGDERKTFMSSCLSGKSGEAAAAQTGQDAQRERMRTCNQTATEKTLKGDERKAFMSECLKK